MKKKVLFFISAANYSGATRFSLDVVRFCDKSVFDVRVIFARYHDRKLPEIASDLQRSGVRFTVLNRVIPIVPEVPGKTSGIRRLRGLLGRRLESALLICFRKLIIGIKLRRVCSGFKPDFIYSNSVLLPLKDLRKYVGMGGKVCYRLHLVPDKLSDEKVITGTDVQALDASDRVVVASLSGKMILIERGVRESLLTVMPETIVPPEKDLLARESYRRKLEYTGDQVVICGSGVVSHRKGFDLFLEMARRLSLDPQNNRIKFLWVGGGSLESVAEDPKSTGSVFATLNSLGKRFTWVGSVSNPYDYYSSSDIFVLCSRSDNAALVMLENMSLENPVIAFRESGIPEDELESCGCLLVPHEDVEGLVRAVRQLAGDDEARRKLGPKLRNYILANWDLRKDTQLLETLLGQPVLPSSRT